MSHPRLLACVYPFNLSRRGYITQIIALDNPGDETQCTATTKRGTRCLNPVVFGSAWHIDGTVYSQHYNIAQQKCHKHVDKRGPVPDVRIAFGVFGDDEADAEPEALIEAAARMNTHPALFQRMMIDASLTLEEESPDPVSHDDLVDVIVALCDCHRLQASEAVSRLVNAGHAQHTYSETGTMVTSVKPFVIRLKLIQGGLSERLSNVA